MTRRRWNEGQRKPGEEWPLSRHDSFTKWTAATSATEEAALVMATQLIDAYFTAALQGRRGDNQVVGADHFAGRLQLSPDPRMLKSRLLRVGEDGQRRQHRLQIVPPPGSLRRRPFHSVPEFGHGDGGHFKQVVGPALQPGLEVEGPL